MPPLSHILFSPKLMPKKLSIRYCFSKLWNKQFLIFLFFLALSTVFWLFQTMSETYEEDFLVPIELRGVPSNVVITTELPANLRVQIRDKGNTLLTYRYTRNFKPIVVDFNAVANASGHVTILGSELHRQIAAQLLPGTQLMAIKPDTLDFYYNYGLCKRVPVVVQGDVRTARLFTLAQTRMSQDSVTVYAAQTLLDTITAAYLRPLNMRSLSDTTEVRAEIVKVRGAKFTPAAVDLTFCVDRLVEKTVQVPVQQVNFPASKQLRTFPATVNVTFQVGMGQYRQITKDNFVIVVNYEDLLKNRTNRVRLSLKTIPAGTSHVRISPQEVEYIIEEISENAADLE